MFRGRRIIKSGEKKEQQILVGILFFGKKEKKPGVGQGDVRSDRVFKTSVFHLGYVGGSGLKEEK